MVNGLASESAASSSASVERFDETGSISSVSPTAGSNRQQSLADRLRAKSKSLDHDEIAARLAVTRQGRVVEQERVAREAEPLQAKELEQQRKAEVRRELGMGHEL
jgi:hypothetical protein